MKIDFSFAYQRTSGIYQCVPYQGGVYIPPGMVRTISVNILNVRYS